MSILRFNLIDIQNIANYSNNRVHISYLIRRILYTILYLKVFAGQLFFHIFWISILRNYEILQPFNFKDIDDIIYSIHHMICVRIGTIIVESTWNFLKCFFFFCSYKKKERKKHTSMVKPIHSTINLLEPRERRESIQERIQNDFGNKLNAQRRIFYVRYISNDVLN